MAQTAGRTIQERDDGQRRAEEGHASLMGKAAFFYADNGLVSSTDLGWLQYLFDTLTVLFDQVGLQTHVCNTMRVVCKPCRSSGVQAYEA